MRRSMRRSLIGVVLVAGTLIASSGTASAAVSSTRDGSFEKPAVAAGGFRDFTTGQSFSGWRVVGAKGDVAIVSGKYRSAGITFDAKAGQQWMDLTGFGSNTPTGIAQTFSSMPHAVYHLTFWVGNVYDPGGVFGVSSKIKVYVNGARKLTAENSRRTSGVQQVWKKFTLTIRATSSRTTISFVNGDPHSDNSNGLDAVRVS
jgi:hypothetical protein